MPGEHLRVGPAGHDPGLEGDPDFLGDTAVVELGDDVQLRTQVVGDANGKRPHLTGYRIRSGWRGGIGHDAPHLLLFERPTNPGMGSSA